MHQTTLVSVGIAVIKANLRLVINYNYSHYHQTSYQSFFVKY